MPTSDETLIARTPIARSFLTMMSLRLYRLICRGQSLRNELPFYHTIDIARRFSFFAHGQCKSRRLLKLTGGRDEKRRG